MTRTRHRDTALALVLLGPPVVIFGWFSYWPFWRLIHYSLHQQNRAGTRERWVGPSQLTETLTGPQFAQGVRVTFLFLLFTVPLGILLGILLALSAHRRLRGIKIFQAIFSSTVASSVAVAAVVFFTLVNPQIGYFRDVSWLDLNKPLSALFAVSLSATWQSLGLTFIVVLAALQAVPDEVLEAAILDGYSPVRRFFRVTVPMISPALLFLVVVLSVRAFQAYAEIEILTQGGPAGGTETLLFKITRLQQPSVLGQGAAMSLGLFGLTLLLAAGQLLLLERRVHYG